MLFREIDIVVSFVHLPLPFVIPKNYNKINNKNNKQKSKTNKKPKEKQQQPKNNNMAKYVSYSLP
jgi:hypothetical protein